MFLAKTKKQTVLQTAFHYSFSFMNRETSRKPKRDTEEEGCVGILSRNGSCRRNLTPGLFQTCRYTPARQKRALQLAHPFQLLVLLGRIPPRYNCCDLVDYKIKSYFQFLSVEHNYQKMAWFSTIEQLLFLISKIQELCLHQKSTCKSTKNLSRVKVK